MDGFDILITCTMVLLGLTLVFLIFAKKRMDRNEPVFGWARKQHMQETGQNQTSPSGNVKLKKGSERIIDMLSLEDVKAGIFEKKHNEYCLIVSSDSVNYDLLSEGARQAIILGYSSLYRVIRFPVQILGQAVTQDLRREEERFEINLKKCNTHTRGYNNSVIQHIKERSQEEFRITRKTYYVVSYVPQTGRMGALSPEDRAKDIQDELYQRAWTIVQMLKQCDIQSEILDSLRAMEVLKRALNRDRMVVNPIDDVADREKLSSLYVTIDPTTLPGYEDLVNDVEEVRGYVQEAI
ncbi:hypothetical protein ABER99_20565 [Paenibacillus glucanolyticus]|uniref:Uncharacterized protein n=1 Tax=Paenibacillus glucanolyticus TaxID=59843 RepID=A0A168EWU3_9BACL|nr:hypothetical protein [Paenibacillus glucanolyticus]KZS44901.1 hypothetical protein AWU65_02650 [Paenibacillus glucanolyticus]OMF65550.1 hypothetical protein BK142_30530 [Paenibacillus glucanolyticus]